MSRIDRLEQRVKQRKDPSQDVVIVYQDSEGRYTHQKTAETFDTLAECVDTIRDGTHVIYDDMNQ